MMGKEYHRNWYLSNKPKLAARARARYRANREKSLEYSRRRYLRKKEEIRQALIEKKYGIPYSVYQSIHDAQGGVCAICQNPCTCGRKLAVDHDHETGKVRGLLCSRCNRGLGLFQESPDHLGAALAYLKKYTT